MMGGAFGVPHSIALTPGVRLIPWRKSVLASCETLGNTYRSITLEIEWIGFEIGFSFGHNINTLSQLP